MDAGDVMLESARGPLKRWRHIGHGEEVLTDQSGKIVGEVRLGYRRYSAWIDVRPLGEYVDEASAKRAVEAALFVKHEPVP